MHPRRANCTLDWFFRRDYCIEWNVSRRCFLDGRSLLQRSAAPFAADAPAHRHGTRRCRRAHHRLPGFLRTVDAQLAQHGTYVGLALVALGPILFKRHEIEEKIWGPPESPEFDRIRRCTLDRKSVV